jgi:S-DNA-T family DNA segregation ATPase FtsK/SpoIIIE
VSSKHKKTWAQDSEHEKVRAIARALRGALVWAGRWHPWSITMVAAAVAVVWLAGPITAIGVALVAGIGLGVWWRWAPASFEAVVVVRARSGWRREWVYRRRWERTMWLVGLAVTFDGDDVIPTLGRVTARRVADTVAVRLPEAQERRDWTNRASSIAASFGALECRVSAPRPHWVALELVYRRDIPVVPALRIPGRPDLDELAIGRRSDGRLWRLGLASAVHLMVCGATSAGKGSVIWSIIRALAGGVRAGTVALWVADPKGGMELGHGPLDDATGEPMCPMFTRFATNPAGIAGMLDDATELMARRARRLAGRARTHTASRTEPTVVVIVDELAAITAFATDAERERVARALGLLLSQGRAVGFHVIVACQDPRKAVVKVRDLIPVRIGLRMVDADHVDATLGKTAWVNGARCEDIPTDAPGCGWVHDHRTGDLVWVRASWIDDDDIATMATDYPAPGPALTVIDGHANPAAGDVEGADAADAEDGADDDGDAAAAGGDR